MGLIQEIRSAPADPENIYSVLNTLHKYVGYINTALESAHAELNQRVSVHQYSIGNICRNKDRCGGYIIHCGSDSLFCGLRPPLWNNIDGKEFVYSLCIPKIDIKNRKKIDKKKYPNFQYKDGLYIQIDRKIFEGKDPEDELCKRIVDIVKNVYEKYTKW
jgi:hypothetical protein